MLWLPVVAMAGGQILLSSQSRLPRFFPSFSGVDKLEHAAWFFFLGLFAYRAGRVAEGWSRRGTITVLLVAAAAWGVSDEWHQSFVPGRAVEAADLAADVAGVALAMTVAEPLLRRLRLLATSP
ncbi:MAG TPA: VanZ family protein [Holophaga sp.]|nr:VanZ family protein [Holophaga sp.]